MKICKKKKRTRATIAKEKGLEALANYILKQKENDLNIYALKFVDKEKGVETIEEAIQGACDIIAEDISENAYYRKNIRRMSFMSRKICMYCNKS